MIHIPYISKKKQPEANKYYNLYRAQKYFAVIKAGGSVCLTNEFLTRIKKLYEIGLIPIIVHGAGNQIDAELDRLGIEEKKDKNGMRITDKKTLEVVVDVTTKMNNKIVKSLEGIAEPLNGIFYAEPATNNRDNYTGNVSGFDKGVIDNCLYNRKVPIITSLGIYPVPLRGKVVQHPFNINADWGAASLIKCLNPLKAVFLTTNGGVYKRSVLTLEGETFKKKDLIPEVTKKELIALAQSKHIKGGMGVKLEAIESVLNYHDVQLTSALNLFLELFTDEGYGTYIRKKVINFYKEKYEQEKIKNKEFKNKIKS